MNSHPSLALLATLASLAAGCGDGIVSGDKGDAAGSPSSDVGSAPPDAGAAGDSGHSADAGPDASAAQDAGPADAAPEPPGRDAGGPDAGLPDAERPDAGPQECQPGETDSRACGTCDSGEQTRLCSASGAWQSWGACASEESGFPGDPWTGNLICPPYDRPAVFFAPHPDDESLGMAGAIREHLLAGRPVFVELLTHGEASGIRATLADGATDSWHTGSHGYSLSATEFGNARVAEFTDALQRLGVTGLHVSDFGDGSLTTAEVGERIGFWLGQAPTGLSLKGTAGPQDPATSGGSPHPDHLAVWSALTGSSCSDIRGYLVYQYRDYAGSPSSTIDISTWCAAKQDALEAYQVWDPGNGRYAIGYHSVSGLIDTAASDCREFLVVP